MNAYRTMIDIVERAYDGPHPALAAGYNNIAILQRNEGDHEAALESYNRFYSLFIADHQPLLLIDSAADRLLLTVNPALPASHAPYFAYSTLLGVVKLLGWLCGQRLAPYKITLGFEPFGVDSEFAYLFGTEPEYGNLTRAEYSLEVCRYAVAPVIDASEFSRQRTSYLLLWGMDERFERQVYALVADRLERGRVSSEVIAEQLHMARQTLARRLQEAGTSYSAVLERVRKDKAIAMLRTTTMPLLSVADSLGYSDTRSFSRAFKRWTGKAPGAYRRE